MSKPETNQAKTKSNLAAQAKQTDTRSGQTKPTIEQKVHQLDEQVEWFYSEDFSLDQALDNYQKTVDLAKEIEQDLTELKNRVEVVADLTK